MLKIQVSTSSTGTEDSTHWNYHFIINPTDIDFQDSNDISIIETLHGSPVIQKSTFDSRIRKLIWNGPWGATNTTLPSIAIQVASIRSFVGSVRYFNFKDLDRLNITWPVTNIWKKARVVDLQTKIKPNSPELRYENITLEIVPEM